MSGLARDFMYAVRALRKNLLVSILATASLSLAIAGNATVFSMVSAFLLRPLPYENPDTLVFVWQKDKENPAFDLTPVSPGNFVDWREARSFAAMAAMRAEPLSLTGGDRPEPLIASSVTSDFFSILGASAWLGRIFTAEDAERRVVILNHRFWETRFGSDRELVGTTIELGGEAFEVIGVMPAEFEFFDPRGQAWIPLDFPPSGLSRERRELLVVARLAPGTRIEDARAEMEVLADRLAREYPDANRGYGVNVFTIRDQLDYGGNRELMLLLQGALIFVLLIASSNLANLLLARGQVRQRELALRAALGASRGRILRELLSESLLLAAFGGLLGLGLAYVGVKALSAAFAGQISRAFVPEMDATVLVFTLAVTAFAAIVFGLAPALQASKTRLTESLREGGRGTTIGGRRRLLAKGLVVSEISLALVLLCGAGLAIQSFRDLQGGDPGFETDHLLTFDLVLPTSRYADDRSVAEFYQRLVEALSVLPGVESAAVANHPPYTFFPPKTAYGVPGDEPRSEGPRPSATFLVVSSSYFDTLEMEVLAGRALNETDRDGAAPVIAINEALARRLGSGSSLVGERLDVQGLSREIVGVVANVKEDALFANEEGEEPILYLPQGQLAQRAVSVLVRTGPDPASLADPVRDATAAIDNKLSITRILSYQGLLDEFFVGARVMSALLLVFGGLALGLAGVGIYGVVAFSVSRRTHELGVRSAMGANRRAVIRLVLGEGLRLAALGFAIGLPGVILVVRAIQSVFAGFASASPANTIPVALVLFLTAVVASYVPARRAASVAPTVALRHE